MGARAARARAAPVHRRPPSRPRDPRRGPARGMVAPPADRDGSLVVHRHDGPVPRGTLRADDRLGCGRGPIVRHSDDGRAHRGATHPARGVLPPDSLHRLPRRRMGGSVVPVRRSRVRRNGATLAFPRAPDRVLRDFHSTRHGGPHLGPPVVALAFAKSRRDPDALAVRRGAHVGTLTAPSRSEAIVAVLRTDDTYRTFKEPRW